MSEPTFITNLVTRFRSLVAEDGIPLDETLDRIAVRELQDRVGQHYRAGLAGRSFLDELLRVTNATKAELENKEVHAALESIIDEAGCRWSDMFIVMTAEMREEHREALKQVIFKLEDEAFDEGLMLTRVGVAV